MSSKKDRAAKNEQAAKSRVGFELPEDMAEPSLWLGLITFLEEKVPRWARGEKVEISDRSQGHNFVYRLATGHHGNSSVGNAYHLYSLYVETIAKTTDGRRRATERDMHDKIVKTLTGSIFKYLDQVHVDKGCLPDLKMAAKCVWNDPAWVPQDWLDEQEMQAQNNPQQPACADPSAGFSNPHGIAGDVKARQEALKVLQSRHKIPPGGACGVPANKLSKEPVPPKETNAQRLERMLKEEFGTICFEEMEKLAPNMFASIKSVLDAAEVPEENEDDASTVSSESTVVGLDNYFNGESDGDDSLKLYDSDVHQDSGPPKSLWEAARPLWHGHDALSAVMPADIVVSPCTPDDDTQSAAATTVATQPEPSGGPPLEQPAAAHVPKKEQSVAKASTGQSKKKKGGKKKR